MRRVRVTLVDDHHLPIPAVSTGPRREDEDHVDVNLPLLAGLMPPRYPQRIDPRTLMIINDYGGSTTTSDEEEWERDYEVNDDDDDDDDDYVDMDEEETLFMMMILGGVDDDHRRNRRRRRRRGPRPGRNDRRRSRFMMRASSSSRSRIELFRSYVTTVTTRRIEGGNVVVEEAVGVDDDGGTMPLPVIRFVGDRVGTGERCVRSDHPFPPDCRRVVVATSSLSTLASSSRGDHRRRCRRRRMSGFLSSLLLVGRRGDDHASDEPAGDYDDGRMHDDNNVDDNPPSSPGRLIISKCKRGIIGRLESLRGGLKRASLICRDGDCDHDNDDDDNVVDHHPRPFVIPTVILDNARREIFATGGTSNRGLVVDVTPRLVAYFEVTIVKIHSSTNAAPERFAVDGVEPLGYNHRMMVNADNRRHRQRQDGRRRTLNQAPLWMPMMMMPMYPFPLELIPMMNTLEWDRLLLGAGGRMAESLNHGAFQEHDQRLHEMHHRSEREQQAHERERLERRRREWQERREEQQHGRAQLGEIDVWRQRHQEQQELGRGHRHECVGIGLSTRYFSPADKMPGWDRESFGYHGDDGGLYHGRGDMLRRYGPSYGPGDTVGCGLEYSSRRIFFVKNGMFLGYAFGDGCDDVGGGELSSEIIDRGLYPTVGVDTECPISVNFGERPFTFDLREFASATDRKCWSK